MKKTAAVFIMLAALTAAATPAEPPSNELRRERIIELLTVMQLEKRFRADVRATIDATKKNYATRFNPPTDLSAEELARRRAGMAKQMSERFDRYETLFFQKLDFNVLREEVYIPLYEKHFSDAEIRDLLAFYRTPTGAKAAEVLPVLNGEVQQKVTAFVDPLIASVTAQIRKEEEDRHPWRRTMSDMKVMSISIEAYQIDNELYPEATSTEQLKSVLSPTYIRAFPEKDSWGNAYAVVISPDRLHYRFVSAGADGVFEPDSRRIGTFVAGEKRQPRKTENLAADIIYQDGEYVQLPAAADSD